jgi:hypothetical protein
MDEGLLIALAIMIVLNLICIYLLIDGKNSLPKGEEIHDRLDEMFDALNVVANVLQQLPNLVPQFSIEQNPLINAVTEWIRVGREEPQPQPSIVHHELEAPDGEGD